MALKIKNNDISFNRGETVTIEFLVYTADGKPYILPPKPSENIKPVLALTVRSGNYDSIVLVKYLDLSDKITYGGIVDNSANGYNKFTSQEIEDTDNPETYYQTVENRTKVCRVTGTTPEIFYCWASNTEDPLGDGQVVGYSFALSIPITFEDTSELEAKAYVYDIIGYMGILKENVPETEFPLDIVLWKNEFITPHKFLLEDTNNA